MQLLDDVLGLSLRAEQLGYGHMAARAAFMYLAMIVLIRLGKKRALGDATAFDVLLVIILGSVAARAMTGGAPFFPSLAAMVLMIAIHWVLSAIARDWPAFGGLIKGHSTLVIKDGTPQREALRAAHMTKDDLDEDLRQKGVGDVAEVAEARLERSGKLSVIRK